MSKRGLGKGLSALIPEIAETTPSGAIEVEIKEIRPNPSQPRQAFDPERLAELAASIQEHGVVQPVVLRPATAGGARYEIVAGERRWRAATLAGLQTIPAVVRDVSARAGREIALIENLQREDLNPIEEAEAYNALMTEFGLTQEELARRVGKSRPHIANSVRLLHLPDPVRAMVVRGEVSMGHAKVLLGVRDAQAMVSLANRAAEGGWSVRELEERSGGARGENVRRGATDRGPGPGEPQRDPEVIRWEAALRERLGSPVRIITGTAKGRIEISFYGEDDLTRLVEALVQAGRGRDGGSEKGRRLTV